MDFFAPGVAIYSPSNGSDSSYSGANGPAFDAAYADSTGGGDMAAPLGIVTAGMTANDGNPWSVVGN